MTAVNIVLADDAVHIVTDGLSLGRLPDGSAVPVALNKVWLFPQIGCAIAVRGQIQHGVSLVGLVPYLGNSFDEVRRRIGVVVPAMWEGFKQGWRATGLTEAQAHYAEIFVAGISSEGPAAFAFITHGFYKDVPRMTRKDLYDHLTMAPLDFALHDQCRTMARNLSSDDDLDRLAVMMIDGQRTARTTTVYDADHSAPSAPGADQIGGFVQVTTVRASGIATRVVHHWPDEVGNQEREDELAKLQQFRSVRVGPGPT